jgi:hypothetical protein
MTTSFTICLCVESGLGRVQGTKNETPTPRHSTEPLAHVPRIAKTRGTCTDSQERTCPASHSARVRKSTSEQADTRSATDSICVHSKFGRWAAAQAESSLDWPSQTSKRPEGTAARQETAPLLQGTGCALRLKTGRRSLLLGSAPSTCLIPQNFITGVVRQPPPPSQLGVDHSNHPQFPPSLETASLQRFRL